MTGKFYITTAIDYVNNRPHLGTSYEKVCADIIARYRKLRGDDVRFLMGNDEHSLKVETAARELGKDPLVYCDEMEAIFRDVWSALDIEFDDFIRTTQPRHVKAVSEIVRRIHEAGDIEEGVYEGWYCNGCEAFKTDGELEDGRCPDHASVEPQWLKERNYFFKLSRYNDFLLDHYEKYPEFVQPVVRRNEMLELLRSGLRDISISRESAKWGVPVPFDENAVVYVWFDALVNYVAGLGWPDDTSDFETWWPADVHLVGKDITRFHCVIWPAMLKSAGLPLPKQIFGHGFVNLPSGRMSKSEGTIVDPKVLVEKYGADVVRYYLAAEATFGRDLEYTEERLAKRSNADLANSLGNLASRTISMIVKYRDGIVPAVSGETPMIPTIEDARERYREKMDHLDLRGGIEAAMSIVDRANQLVDDEAPWALAKDPEQAERLDRVLYDLADACRAAAVLLFPVMPQKMQELLDRFGCAPAAGSPPLEDARFGLLDPGTTLEKGSGLFPRIEIAADEATES